MALDPQHIRAAVQSYLDRHQAKDAAGVAALFAVDAEVFDPVGSEPHMGSAAVEAFFAGTHQMSDSMEFTLTGPIRVAGNHAAFPFEVRTAIGETTLRLQIIDVMDFADDGLIQTMRAYWSFADAIKE